METKYNEATINRPEGDRIIDAPFVFIDLKKYNEQLKDEKAWKENDRNSITVYKTDGYTVVLCRLHSGATIMDNQVDGLITIQVLKGAIDFSVETGNVYLTEQQMVSIHPGIIHSVRATEKSLLLITSKTEKEKDSETSGDY